MSGRAGPGPGHGATRLDHRTIRAEDIVAHAYAGRPARGGGGARAAGGRRPPRRRRTPPRPVPRRTPPVDSNARTASVASLEIKRGINVVGSTEWYPGVRAKSRLAP